MPTTPTLPSLHYQLAGSGPPMLLIMGFGMRGKVWEPTARHLCPHFSVCTYDHRDIGASDPTDVRYTMRDLATDAVRVLDALGWADAHIVGVSMGGMAAQELALIAPERVRTLTLVATQSGGPRAWIPPLRGLVLTAGIALGSERLNRRLLPRLLHPRGSTDHISPEDEARRWTDAHAEPPSTTVRRRQLTAVRSHDTRSRLGAIRSPTLVVKPVHDRMCAPRRSDTLARAIPGAQLLEMDAGHGLIHHAGDRLAAAIRTFIDAQAPTVSD